MSTRNRALGEEHIVCVCVPSPLEEAPGVCAVQ